MLGSLIGAVMVFIRLVGPDQVWRNCRMVNAEHPGLAVLPWTDYHRLTAGRASRFR